jgi:DNA-directed RNA polymerase specialized sigma24 family protein
VVAVSLSAITPAYQRRVGSSAIFEAVDEALAQIVAAGDHLREPDQVKALWITYARRRVIDGQRSAEFKHRAVHAIDDTAPPLCASSDELLRLTDEARQWWRIREILSVLRGDQRRWAEAWYDHVLSASRAQGVQPRGLPEALGWTPSKTKTVSRRARAKMAAFIDDRTSGAVCDEQRTLFDSFILAGKPGAGVELDAERYQAVLFHVAGCEDCWAAWHTRRRSLLGRCGAMLAAPIDSVAVAAQGLESKLASLAHGVYAQGSSLLARLGIGGAAAAGGGAATIGGKAAAVCVGVVCAATAGGELAGVLRPVAPPPVHQKRDRPEHAVHVPTDPRPTREAAGHVLPPAPQPPAVSKVAPADQIKAAVRTAPALKKTFVARSPTQDQAPTAGPSETFGATQPPVAPPPTAATATPNPSTCVPGDLGC